MDYPLKVGMLDSHFHGLIMHGRGISVGPLLRQLTECGFSGGIDVSTTPTDLTDRRNMYADHPDVLLSSGIHPGQCGHDPTRPALDLLAGQLGDPSIRPAIAAIGEMGLDWYRGDEHRAEQMTVFMSQLDLAVGVDLPVIIHNREADDDVLTLVSEAPGVRGVMHCFSSDVAFARRCLDRGLYISFAGNVTYKRSEGIRAAAQYVPADRLLLETDSPFLSPQQVRGKPNNPGHISFTYEYVAGLRNVPIESLVEDVAENFRSLFRASLPQG